MGGAWLPGSQEESHIRRDLIHGMDLLGNLLVLAFFWFFPEEVPKLAQQTLEKSPVGEWLQWVGNATRQEWPPTVTVWGA